VVFVLILAGVVTALQIGKAPIAVPILQSELKRHDITLNRFGIPKSIGF